jgi:prevent-host-death family protein
VLVVNIHEAKTQLSRLLQRALLGEEIVIAKAGRPIARLTPLEQPPAPRTPGSARGRFEMAPDFDDPLPEDLLAEFER